MCNVVQLVFFGFSFAANNFFLMPKWNHAFLLRYSFLNENISHFLRISSPWRLSLIDRHILLWIGYLYLQFLNCKKRRKKKLLKWEGRHLKLLELWYYSCKAVRGSRFPNVKQLLPRLESSLQSRQVKRTPWDSSNELIIWKMNPLVVPATSVKFKSAFLQASWAVNILRELLCIWSDWKSLNGLNFLEDIYIKFRVTELVEIS